MGWEGNNRTDFYYYNININSERALQTVVSCAPVRGVMGKEAGLELRDPVLILFGCWAARLVKVLPVIYLFTNLL